MTTQTKYRKYDSESDYYAMGYRMYSAEFGRFLAVDPLFETMPRHNPYHYSYNSPMFWSDPSGLVPVKEKGKGGEKLLMLQLDTRIFEEAYDGIVEENGRAYARMSRTYSYDLNNLRTNGNYFTWNIWNAFNVFDLYMGSGGGSGGSVAENTENSRSGISGSGTSGTMTFSFDWNGKRVYVKYNPSKIIEKHLQEKITKALDDIALGDDEGVIAALQDFCFDFSMTSTELAELWNNNCDKNWEFLAGFAQNSWRYFKEDGQGCPGSFLDGNGWISIASEYIIGNTSELNGVYYFDVRQIGTNNNESFIISMPLSMVMSHEIKHVYDSTFGSNYLSDLSTFYFDKEFSANNFMYNVWMNNNPGLMIIKSIKNINLGK